MNTSKLGGKVAAKHNNIHDSEHDIVASQALDEEAKAHARLTHATAADQEKLTELKEFYAGAVLRFMWVWFVMLVATTGVYFIVQIISGKGIPKEVMISLFTCTAVVIGLVGYILKGLFGSK